MLFRAKSRIPPIVSICMISIMISVESNSHEIASFGMSLSGNPCASKIDLTLSHLRPVAFAVVVTAIIAVTIHSIMALIFVVGSFLQEQNGREGKGKDLQNERQNTRTTRSLDTIHKVFSLTATRQTRRRSRSYIRSSRIYRDDPILRSRIDD